MKVYIIEGYVEYEASEVLALYQDRERAEQYIIYLKLHDNIFDGYDLEEYEVIMEED